MATSPVNAFRTKPVNCIICRKCSANLMAGTAGIAADNYSHVQYFPSSAAYEDYLTVPEVRRILKTHMIEYRALVLQDHLTPGTTVKKALSIHKKFHLLTQQPYLGKVPFGCSCAVCFPHCICQDTLLFASLFDQEVRVPDAWVAATVSTGKVCKASGGTAGRQAAPAHVEAGVRREDYQFQG